MKKTRKLVPAIALLLISALLLSTASYAWFSMNTTVTATEMQITAQSDSTYLLISQQTGVPATAASIQAENSGAGFRISPQTIDANDSKVYPSAHTATVTNAATATAFANWYYKVADGPNASASTSSEVPLTTLEAYVLHKTVYLTLAAGSNDAANLKVTAATIASNDSVSGTAETFTPVKVIVASATTMVEIPSTGEVPTNTLVTTMNDDTVVKLDIFIYYDGNDTAVYTNNIANLEGATVDLTFGVD